MSEAPAECWFIQAKSDLAAGVKLFVKDDPATYCQAIAKYQQAVEKSIKGLVAGLRDAGVLSYQLRYTHDVKKPMAVLARIPRGPNRNEIPNAIRGLLYENRRNLINTLCDLAPKAPPPGQLPCRNTEYPFQFTKETWSAPAQAGVFRINETADFFDLAQKVLSEAPKLVSAAQRGSNVSH